MALSINFRSDKTIIENSNKYSSLKAVGDSKKEGIVNKNIIWNIDDLIDIIKCEEEVAVLVRTNAVIKKLELELLKRKIPMKYFNYITDLDFKNYKEHIKSKTELNFVTNKKLKRLKNSFESHSEVFAFIEANKKSRKFVTTIHKSKGREFNTCVVVNSIAPDVLYENGILQKLDKKQLSRISFMPKDPDVEPKNIHYVAVSRSKHSLYFMMYDY